MNSSGTPLLPMVERSSLMAWLLRWILEIRVKNYKEYNNIIYNNDKKFFEYWGSSYQGFRFKFDDFGELKIIPIEYIEAVHPEGIFSNTMMKLQNALYDLDTQKCKWIIDHRKYLGI